MGILWKPATPFEEKCHFNSVLVGFGCDPDGAAVAVVAAVVVDVVVVADDVADGVVVAAAVAVAAGDGGVDHCASCWSDAILKRSTSCPVGACCFEIDPALC